MYHCTHRTQSHNMLKLVEHGIFSSSCELYGIIKELNLKIYCSFIFKKKYSGYKIFYINIPSVSHNPYILTFTKSNFRILFDFLVPLIDIDTSTLLGWCTINGQDSSVGRAEDWKSSCHQFKSGSWHRKKDLPNRYWYKLLEMDWDTYSLKI